MANELTLSGLRLQFSKTAAPSYDLTLGSLSIAVAGTVVMDNVQTVGATEEAILLGDVTAGGMMLCQNLDSTNYVSIRAGTGLTDLIKILPGEWCLFRCKASAPFIIADTAPCNVRILHFSA